MKALFATALVALSLVAGVATVSQANAADVGSSQWWQEYDRTHSNG